MAKKAAAKEIKRSDGLGRQRRHKAGRERNAEQHGHSRGLILLGRAITRTAFAVPDHKQAKFAALVANGTITGGASVPSRWKEWR